MFVITFPNIQSLVFALLCLVSYVFLWLCPSVSFVFYVKAQFICVSFVLVVGPIQHVCNCSFQFIVGCIWYLQCVLCFCFMLSIIYYGFQECGSKARWKMEQNMRMLNLKPITYDRNHYNSPFHNASEFQIIDGKPKYTQENKNCKT